MRHGLVWIPIALAIGVLVVLLWDREPGSDPGTDLGRSEDGSGKEPPRLEGQAQPEPVAPEEVLGPASISGTVTRDGKPAGARVEVRKGRYGFGSQNSLLWPPFGDGDALAVADAAEDGTFCLEGLDLGNYEVTARAEDGASAWARGHCRSRSPHEKVSLALFGGPGVLVGRAVHADQTPFRGFAYAYVGPHPRGRMTVPLRQVATDAEGRFRLENLPEGEIDVILVAPERFRSAFSGVAVPQLSERVFVIEDGLTTYEGTVVADDTGEPVPGAEISYDGRIRDPRRRYTGVTSTDEAGAFEVYLPALTGTLWVRAEGFAPLQYPLKPDKGLDFRLERRGRVTGRVVEKEGGRPVSGAALHGWNWHTFGMKSPLDVSAEDGTFTAEVGPGKGMIYVLDADWASHGLSRLTQRGLNPTYVEVGQGETAEIVVEVVQAGRVEGTLTDAAGRPLSGAPVTVLHPPKWKGFSQVFLHGELCSTVTDAEGHYSIGGLIPEFPYQVQAQPAEGLPVLSEPVTAVSGTSLEVDLRVPADVHLTVRVVETATGEPVAGAHVRASQRGHTASGVTAADGQARLGPLLPATLRLHVAREGYVSPTGDLFRGGGLVLEAPTPDAEPVVVELSRGGYFEGRILASDGSPWTGGGMLGVHPVGEPAGRGLGLVGGYPIPESGSIPRLGPVTPGTYDLILVEGALSNRKLIARWTVETGTGDLSLRIDPAQAEEAERNRVLLEVVDARGEKASGWIRVYTMGGGYWRWRLTKGAYYPDGLEPGTTVWVLVYEAVNPAGEKVGGTWAGPIQVKAGPNRIELPPPKALAGRVLGPDGKPVGGLRLSVESVPPDAVPYVPETFALPAVRTDATGRFEVEGLAPGAHNLLLDLPDDYALVTPPMVTAGRDDVEIRLRSAEAVTVRVLAKGEAPIAGAVVKATLAGVAGGVREAVTDREGVARLGGLAPSATYDFTVEPPETRRDLAGIWAHGWAPASADVTLPAGRVIKGTVRKADSAAAYTVVEWKDRREIWQEARADGNGAFRVTVLADSEVTFRVEGETVEVGPEQTEVALTMP